MAGFHPARWSELAAALMPLIPYPREAAWGDGRWILPPRAFQPARPEGCIEVRTVPRPEN